MRAGTLSCPLPSPRASTSCQEIAMRTLALAVTVVAAVAVVSVPAAAGGDPYAFLHPDQRLTLALRVAAVEETRAPLTLAGGQKQLSVVAALRDGDLDGARVKFGALVTNMANFGEPLDIEALVQIVIRQAIIDSNEDL